MISSIVSFYHHFNLMLVDGQCLVIQSTYQLMIDNVASVNEVTYLLKLSLASDRTKSEYKVGQIVKTR